MDSTETGTSQRGAVAAFTRPSLHSALWAVAALAVALLLYQSAQSLYDSREGRLGVQQRLFSGRGVNLTDIQQSLEEARQRVTAASSELRGLHTVIAQQQTVLRQQQQILADQQAHFNKQQIALVRHEPRWYPELEPESKLDCLRESFANGTARVEFSVYSQYGEDGIIEAIFRCIGHRDKHYLELGAETCKECTSRYLRDQGWRGVVMDGNHADSSINLWQAHMTADNIAGLLKQHRVPRVFDQLTVDLDMNTWWVLQSVLKRGHRPRAITVEFNRNLPPFEAIVVAHNESAVWAGDCHFGASIGAFAQLMYNFGYHVVAQDSEGVNLFIVHAPETGSEAPFELSEVVEAVAARGHACWPLHRACGGKRWLVIPEGLELWRERDAWIEMLTPVTLTQQTVLRRDGRKAAVFTQYELIGDSMKRRKNDNGTRLDVGCGVRHDGL